jgi:tetratricopeptide (TPR) repeat protein
VAFAAAGAVGIWFWQQYSHPGLIHYRRGMEYAEAHEFAAAEREWQQGVEEDPKFPGCYVKLGDLYAQGRNPAAAALKYAAAAPLSPRDGQLFLHLARVQRELNDTAAAADAARHAAALLPSDADAATLCGELTLKIGDLPTALAAYRRAQRLRPTDAGILHQVARLELDMQDIAGAERDLAPWLRAHPDDLEACYLMGAVYNRKPRTPENVQTALDYARRAVAGAQHAREADLLLGQISLDADRPEEALTAFQAAAAGGGPNNEAVLAGLVSCYRRLARPREADQAATQLRQVVARHERINSLQRALNLNPADVAAGLELPRLEEADGDRATAQADYLRVLRQVPNDPRTHKAIAEFYRRIGRPDLAESADVSDSAEDSQ